MKFYKGFLAIVAISAFVLSASTSEAGGQTYGGDEDPNKKILKQGLLGAGVGAISAEASGGKAGKGALIGAGTNVIGGALLDSLTSSPKPQPQQVVYAQPPPAQYGSQGGYPVQQQTYVEPPPPQPVYYQQAPPPQQNPNNKILKNALLGAGTGAIASSASGGKAGKGALIGAGTNVIGGALLDSLMGGGQQQPAPQPVYYQQAPTSNYAQTSAQPKKKIIRKYDSQGNIVSEEEVWE